MIVEMSGVNLRFVVHVVVYGCDVMCLYLPPKKQNNGIE
jgi:hypothetical protein